MALVAAGKSVGEVARLLEVSDQSIYSWRRQEEIDTGELPGLSLVEREELPLARLQIRALETEAPRPSDWMTDFSVCPGKAEARSAFAIGYVRDAADSRQLASG